MNHSGEEIEEELFDFKARMFLHELDHINGKTMTHWSLSEGNIEILEDEDSERLGKNKNLKETIHFYKCKIDELRDNWKDLTVGLLKIDVEGYEEEVFKGASELLLNERPHFIMFESLSGKIDDGIMKILGNFKYIPFQIDKNGSSDFLNFKAQNLFAVSEEFKPFLST